MKIFIITLMIICIFTIVSGMRTRNSSTSKLSKTAPSPTRPSKVSYYITKHPKGVPSWNSYARSLYHVEDLERRKFRRSNVTTGVKIIPQFPIFTHDLLGEIEFYLAAAFWLEAQKESPNMHALKDYTLIADWMKDIKTESNIFNIMKNPDTSYFPQDPISFAKKKKEPVVQTTKPSPFFL